MEVPERAVWDALDRAGIAEPVRTELAHSGITAGDIAKAAASARGKNKQVGALVLDLRARARLRANELESKALAEQARNWLEDQGEQAVVDAVAAFVRRYSQFRSYSVAQIRIMPSFLNFVSETLRSRSPPGKHSSAA